MTEYYKGLGYTRDAINRAIAEHKSKVIRGLQKTANLYLLVMASAILQQRNLIYSWGNTDSHQQVKNLNCGIRCFISFHTWQE
ncbi:MAG: hypothetical protein EDM70_18655 [Candidatus Brocadia sp. AMX2]|nr:MAG: hypothetical protein EDM70_18655 [Candidatus Brocadia sp. AMX2]